MAACDENENCSRSMKMTTRNSHSVKLFYSYAHKDKELRNDLAKHIGKAHISEWYDREIYPGTNWENEIDTNLEQADIVLLLISADFKESDYCSGKEMKRALEREKEKSAYVIPIHMRPVYWPNSPFRHLHIPNSNGTVDTAPNRDQALKEIAVEVYRVIYKILKEKYIKDALEHMALENYQNAYAAYKQARLYAPKDALLCTTIGDLLVILEQPQEALKMYEQAITLEPVNARLYWEKGKILKQLDHHTDALITYRQAVKLKKDDSALYQEIGDILYFLKDLKEALQAYQEALLLQPNDYQLYIRKGDTLFDMNNYLEALKAYEAAEHLKKDDDQIYRNKGKTLLALHRDREALAAYQRVISLKSDDPAVYAKIGLVYNGLGEYELALDAYKNSLALDDSNAQVWRDKGDILVKQGDILIKQEDKQSKLQGARAAYEEAISRAPDNAFFYKDNADVLCKLELYEEALFSYDEAIKRNEAFKGWYSARAETKRKIAEKLYKRYEELMKSASSDTTKAKE
jgi:tetratricopeptide (TPR) repeat protein